MNQYGVTPMDWSLLKEARARLRYALLVFENSCDCGHCGPCRYQVELRRTLRKLNETLKGIR